jgi:hypothetical protein
MRSGIPAWVQGSGMGYSLQGRAGHAAAGYRCIVLEDIVRLWLNKPDDVDYHLVILGGL